MVNWEFKSAETPPDVPRGTLDLFIILVIGARSGKPHTQAAYYLNRHPLEYEAGCICASAEEHDAAGGDGCPTTGWFSDESNFDYDSCYQPIAGKVMAYAAIPDGETAMKLFKGGPW